MASAWRRHHNRFTGENGLRHASRVHSAASTPRIEVRGPAPLAPPPSEAPPPTQAPPHTHPQHDSPHLVSYFIVKALGRDVNGQQPAMGTSQDGARRRNMTTYWPSRSKGGHLGLAKEHTVPQGLGWEARIASENKLNTHLLASDRTAEHAAWLADISRNHACQLRHTPGAGPLLRALPVGTGGRFVPAYDAPPRPRSAAAAAGGGGVAAPPASARRRHQPPPPSTPPRCPASATVPLSAAAAAARARECTLHVQRMSSGRYDEGVYIPAAAARATL